MEYVFIICVAVGLAADAFAVSVVSGGAYEKLHIGHIFRMAAFFALFHAIMPLIGYLAASSVRGYFAGYDHWVEFFILAGIGLKMIYESMKFERQDKGFNPANVGVLLMLSLATSIDALAVGATLSLLASNMIKTVMIIGAVTFVLSCCGVYIGKRFRHFFESKIEAVGGLILIGLGIAALAKGILL